MKTKPKPRLSMKLLWKLAYDFRDRNRDKDSGQVAVFLLEVEKEMKFPIKTLTTQ